MRAPWRGAWWVLACVCAWAGVGAVLTGALALGAPLGAQGMALSAADTSQATAPPPPGVSAALDSARAVRGASLVVSLYTYGPSDVSFERFGHAAIGIRDSLSGEDIAFNWGMFDFDQPNFLLRFLTGDTKYSMAGYPSTLFNNVYQADNRTIRQQVLALTPVERAALADFVAWNAREAHKYYRYDYYSDNCSTRVRDALNRVLGGRLRAPLSTPGSGRSWRGETARILAYNIPLYAGIQVALGRRADAVLSKWDEEFLPEQMADHFATMELSDAAGGRYRLVARDTTLFTANREPLPVAPPAWLGMATLVGIVLGGLVLALGTVPSRAVRVLLSTMVGLWYALGGILGTALLLADTVSRHAPYMGANTTVFALQPLLLVAAVLVPLAMFRGTATRAALGLSGLIAALSVFGVLLQVVPTWSQHSGEILAVIVPVHVAIAATLWRMRRAGDVRSSSGRGAL